MVPINDWTMTTRGSKRVSVTGLGDKRDMFFSNKMSIFKLALDLYSCGTEKIAGRYFRGKIFSREVIFAGRYFRGKIFSQEDIFA